MKEQEIKKRINNFFQDIEDEETRKNCILYCESRFEYYKKIYPKVCDSFLIEQSIQETLYKINGAEMTDDF